MTTLIDSSCGPVPHGSILFGSENHQSLEAPWILPASLKAVAFPVFCGDRPRTQLDVNLQQETKKHRLYKLTLSELGNEKQEVVAAMKNVVTARITEGGILVEGWKGKQQVLSAPWQALAL